MEQKKYQIDRKTASQMLRISTRTLDRYLSQGRLSRKQEHGKVLLNKDELLTMEKGMERAGNLLRNSVQIRRTVSPEKKSATAEEAMRQLAETQRKLESANYRIGQLESQLFQQKLVSPPKEHDDFPLNPKRVQEIFQSKDEELLHLQKQLQRSRINYIVLSIILYVLLSLQPIFWYFLR